MLRIVVTICAVSQLATALPQRQIGGGGVQVQQSGPRPQPTPSNSPSASSLGAFSPAYNQQLTFGTPQQAANPQLRGRVQNPFQAAQPIIISQPGQTASPATPSFAQFGVGGVNHFGGGAGRQILTLRSPNSADEDEYEYEDDDEPTIQTRPSPRPGVQATRTPVRAQSPAQTLGLGGAGRFSSQQQPQPQRQRQPIQQGLNAFAAQPLQPIRSAPRPDNSGQFGIDGKRSRLTTPPPVQTVNRYMKQNDDGSVTWGYENEDGTFKEETLGADCVVRGKYGYVDPDGNKREYEYQTGNPCDPNKKDQEEEEEEDLPDGPSRPQQISGILNARPRPVQQQQQRRPQQQQHLQQQGQIPQYQAQPQYQLS